MPSAYPSGLDALSTSFDDATAMVGNHADAHNDERSALNAIEAELGLNPKGGYADVATRLNALGLGTVQRTVTAATTILSTDVVIFFNAAANISQNLPTATANRMLILKRINTNTFDVSLVPNGSQKIDKFGTYMLAALETLTLVGDGAGWWIV